MTIDDYLAVISADTACRVHVPVGEPRLEPEHTLPPDVWRFYQLSSGVDLFPSGDYPLFFLPRTRWCSPILSSLAGGSTMIVRTPGTPWLTMATVTT